MHCKRAYLPQLLEVMRKKAERARAVRPVMAHLGPEVGRVHVVLKQVVAVATCVSFGTGAMHIKQRQQQQQQPKWPEAELPVTDCMLRCCTVQQSRPLQGCWRFYECVGS
jgi:hypothetical protein